jgi:excisionase family DNA binding protein
MKDHDEHTFLTVAEVAALLRVTPFTVKKWAYHRKGFPQLFPLAGKYLFRKSEILKWMEKRREKFHSLNIKDRKRIMTKNNVILRYRGRQIRKQS